MKKQIYVVNCSECDAKLEHTSYINPLLGLFIEVEPCGCYKYEEWNAVCTECGKQLDVNIDWDNKYVDVKPCTCCKEAK